MLGRAGHLKPRAGHLDSRAGQWIFRAGRFSSWIIQKKRRRKSNQQVFGRASSFSESSHFQLAIHLFRQLGEQRHHLWIHQLLNIMSVLVRVLNQVNQIARVTQKIRMPGL